MFIVSALMAPPDCQKTHPGVPLSFKGFLLSPSSQLHSHFLGMVITGRHAD